MRGLQDGFRGNSREKMLCSFQNWTSYAVSVVKLAIELLWHALAFYYYVGRRDLSSRLVEEDAPCAGQPFLRERSRRVWIRAERDRGCHDHRSFPQPCLGGHVVMPTDYRKLRLHRGEEVSGLVDVL